MTAPAERLARVMHEHDYSDGVTEERWDSVGDAYLESAKILLEETGIAEELEAFAALRDAPHSTVDFDGGTTFALTGPNAGHWVEGGPTLFEACPATSPSDARCIGVAHYHETHIARDGTTWRDWAGKTKGAPAREVD